MNEMYAEKILDTLYEEIVDNISDEVCATCPVVRAIRDMRGAINDATREKIIMELGLSFKTLKDCPCMKKT